MITKKQIGIGSVLTIVLLVGVANAGFFGNFMRSPEQILLNATRNADDAKEDYLNALKEKAEATKDVAIDKGEKLQKEDFDKQDLTEINRLRGVLDTMDKYMRSYEQGIICSDGSFPVGL